MSRLIHTEAIRLPGGGEEVGTDWDRALAQSGLSLKGLRLVKKETLFN